MKLYSEHEERLRESGKTNDEFYLPSLPYVSILGATCAVEANSGNLQESRPTDYDEDRFHRW